MYKTRFIRDHALDGLISDLQLLQLGIDHTLPSSAAMSYYIDSLLVVFKTDKEVMIKLESAIEIAKTQNSSQVIVDALADVMTRMQAGIIYLHQALLNNTKDIREEFDISCTYQAENK